MAGAGLLLLLVCWSFSDLIPVHRGFGYDGNHYGRWAQVLSVEALMAPQRERPPGVKITSYNSRRVLPSLGVHYALRVAGVEPTRRSVVRAFRILNLLAITLGVFWWCRAANVLEVGEGGNGWAAWHWSSAT